MIGDFAERAEGIVNKLEQEATEGVEDPDVNRDVDEFIEASELVHNAVKEIRNALLMNRNPEDVDSDNEYEEGKGFLSSYRIRIISLICNVIQTQHMVWDRLFLINK